jgi:hypothetical protein
LQTMKRADAATGDLDCAYFQCLLIDTNVDLAPKTALRGRPLPSNTYLHV